MPKKNYVRLRESDYKDYLRHEHSLYSKMKNPYTIRVWDEEKRLMVDWFYTTGTVINVDTQRSFAYRQRKYKMHELATSKIGEPILLECLDNFADLFKFEIRRA